MMADGEVKQKRRKISHVFKKKNKEDQEEFPGKADGLDAKENERQIEDESGEKRVESANVQDSHERKKKKFGHRRFLPSRKNKSKNLLHEKESENQDLQRVENEHLAIDGDKVEKLEQEQAEKEEEEVVEEKGINEPLKDKGDEFTSEVQNVQAKCDTPEAVIQSDKRETTVQTKANNANENDGQLDNDVRLKEERQSSEEGSVIRTLLRQDVTTEAAKREEQHDSTKHGQEEHESHSNEIKRFIPNVFISNFLEKIILGSKSNNTGTPSENMQKLVLQTADQTYSSLVNLIYALLTTASRMPREALVSFLTHLIKKYPQCFKIKKVKRRENRPDSQVPVDTVN